jgi:amino acid transporter
MTLQSPGADRTDVSSHSTSPPRLERAGLATADLVFFVVAAAAPLTVVAGVVPLAIRTGGLSAAYGYLLPGLLLLLFAAGFTAMSPRVHNAGAFYSYISHGLGRFWGVGASYVAVISYNAMTICLLSGFAVYAQSTLSNLFGLSVPWPVVAAVGLAGVGTLGYFRVTLGARVLGAALGLEVLVLVIYEVAMLIGGGRQGMTVEMFEPSVMTNPGFGAMLVLTAGGFIGFEATAIYAEEVRDPQRTVPRATYIAIGFLAVFYTFSVWCVFVAFGSDGALEYAASDDVAAMTFVSITEYVGEWAADAGQLLLATSAFAAALAFHNAAARYHFTLAREGLLPRGIGRVSARHGSPAGGVAVQAVGCLIVLGFGAIMGADPYLVVFLWSAAPGVIGILALEALTAVAVVAYFMTHSREHSIWRVVIAPGIAAIGLTILVWLCLSQLDLLTAARPLVNWLLVLPLPLAFAVGVAQAVTLKRRDPARYVELNTMDVERGEFTQSAESVGGSEGR